MSHPAGLDWNSIKLCTHTFNYYGVAQQLIYFETEVLVLCFVSLSMLVTLPLLYHDGIM